MIYDSRASTIDHHGSPHNYKHDVVLYLFFAKTRSHGGDLIPSTRCLLCGRPLKNPKHQERGYGPQCWKLVRRQAEKKLNSSLSSSVSDPQLASVTLGQISRMVKRARRKTCDCGKSLTSAIVYTYDHECGDTLPGFSKPQWVFLICRRCGYQWAYWKIHGPSLENISIPSRTLTGVSGQPT